MRLNGGDYRDKVLGCWLGKNIGGTVGAPFEWKRQVNDITFYVQKDLNGTPMPNDDLDIQLLWLCAMEEGGLEVTSRRLAEYWVTYVTPHWAEYGTGKINLRQGLPPPLSGSFQNVYKHSCGSYIRSEIWACIAPGLPHVAARYAYEDATIDHGNGEGVFAEIFMATLESAAFVVPDLRRVVDIGLSYIPADCGVARAVRTTLEAFDAGKSWRELRDEVLRLHRGRLAIWGPVSAEDRAKGFDTGELGYDVPSNIAFTLAGLLYGGEDFGKVQCTCVNLGEDTDCTAATAGSVWGILHGAKAIPQTWIDPIGRGIKTVCLNLGELGYFGNQLPSDVDTLTDRTERLARRLLLQHGAEHLYSRDATDLADVDWAALKSGDNGQQIWGGMSGPRFDFDGFSVHVDYGAEGPVIRNGQPKTLHVTVRNHYKLQANLTLHVYLPEGWQVAPSADGYALSVPGYIGGPLTLDYTFTAERIAQSTNRAVLEITIAGRPTVMLVPITLLNGNLMTAEGTHIR
ncbi:MAG: ADP-ribosylglycohydrolase family protein [Lentisphaerae bacterium]|nr:ADP-ribosylglycohydrolase family protein [Lentisphaerota bacterium]